MTNTALFIIGLGISLYVGLGIFLVVGSRIAFFRKSKPRKVITPKEARSPKRMPDALEPGN